MAEKEKDEKENQGKPGHEPTEPQGPPAEEPAPQSEPDAPPDEPGGGGHPGPPV